MNIQSAAGGEMAGRVFFKDNSLRRELETPVGKQVSITEAGADLMYVLLPGQKIYTEVTNSQVTLDEKEDLEAKFSREGRVTRKGTETIEGYECDIFHIAYNDPSLGESTVWISKDLNYPLKVHSQNPQDRATILYRNIFEENLRNSLFSLPKGYVKFSM